MLQVLKKDLFSEAGPVAGNKTRDLSYSKDLKNQNQLKIQTIS